MRKIFQGVSPIVSIIIITTVGIIAASSVLLYEYLWQPKEYKTTVKNENLEWKEYSNNGGFSFKYPSKICPEFNPSGCYDTKIIEDQDEISIGQQSKENVDYISPIFLIHYVSGVSKKEAEKYISDSRSGYIKVKSWISAGEGDSGKVERMYRLDETCDSCIKINNIKNIADEAEYCASCGNTRIHAVYSEGLHALVMFDLAQLGQACLIDCKVDYDILNSIKLDGIEVYHEFNSMNNVTYTNSKYGFKLVLPSAWTEYYAREVSLGKIEIGLPLETDMLGQTNRKFPITYLEIMSIADYNKAVKDCEGKEMCRTPVELARNSKYVFGEDGVAFTGWDPCADKEVANAEKYFCQAYNDLFPSGDDGSYKYKIEDNFSLIK